jgi:MarR family protein
VADRNPDGEAVYREYIAALVLFHQSAAHAVGLGATDYQALNLLELRGPQTPGALSATLGLTTGATTRLVDRLVAAGHVERSADPADRRKVTVSALASPADFDHLLGEVRAGIGAYVSGLDERQAATLFGYFRAASAAYAEAVTGLAARE